MSVIMENYGYGTKWTDIQTDSNEGYTSAMSDYHMHDYYEISIIFSGDVHVLLSDMVSSGTQPRIVLLRPQVPHYIYCDSQVLYSRTHICFSQNYLADCDPSWQKLLQVFGKNGSVLMLTPAQCQRYRELFQMIHGESDSLRKKLMLLYLLSLISDTMPDPGVFSQIPGYVTQTLSYISTHYAERIVAAELAERLGVGRTTLMTAFKSHTGITVNEYLLRCRLKHAVSLLQDGLSEQETAERCGLTDTCNLIRCFKRAFGMPPRQYLASVHEQTKKQE